MSQFEADCWSCAHLLGLREVSRAPRIFEGEYWNVEHVPETSLAGWTVIVLKRHASALHELSAAEFEELGKLMPALVNALHLCLSPAKEYVMQLAESDHFRHVHFHIVPRPTDWPEHLQGPRVFGALGEEAPGQLSVDEMTAVAAKLQAAVEEYLER